MKPTIYERTRTGVLALNDPGVPLSTGFRRLLRLIDGKRDAAALAREMSHLDVEDLVLWTAELLRQGLIAHAGQVPIDEMAFGLTTEMPGNLMREVLPDPAADALIGDILADLAQTAGAAPAPEVTQRLKVTGRMAVIESVPAFKELESTGFYVYPTAEQALPARARALIAGHLAPQNRILELLFGRAGLTVSIAADRDAMRASLGAAQKPHVMVIDTEMPRLDAFRTMEALRIDAAYAATRIVLVSEKKGQADLANAVMLGAFAFIAKPLRKDVLDAALPRIVGRGNAASN
ncbi:MAG: response regulator [Burkholderiales bacterium]|nr:response regulator [Burkholderiales bacterium]